ncbi:MAG: T9SS type A sorting domain-containing protein, partial [Flavobacteriales bacterium]
GLPCGKTFEVYVRASFDGGATWCQTTMPYGDMCLLTTPCTFSMATEPGSGTLAPDAELRMYPNPNRGDQLFLSMSKLQAGVEQVSVDLFDARGQRVASRNLGAQDGFVSAVLDLHELANGIYMVSISAGEQRFNERLVIQR